MITTTTISRCPYTVAGRGVVRLSHEVIAVLAGAVFDKIEWMAILEGTRSSDGLDITVTGFRVPEQTRNSVNCEFVHPEPLGPADVGVVHSHHSMFASFSTTDDNELNPRFPFSIVVAQPGSQQTDSERLLGFRYEAEGRAPLPCSDNGIIGFTAVPHPLVEGWPEQVPVPGYAKPDESVSLYECPHNKREIKLLAMSQSCETKCGIKTTDKAKAIFGRQGKEFIKVVEANTRKPKHKGWYGSNQGVNGGQVIVVDNRQAGNGKDGYKRESWEQEMYNGEGEGRWHSWGGY